MKVRLLRIALILSSVHSLSAAPAIAQILTLEPLQNSSIAPGPFREACFNIGSWPTVANVTTHLGNAAWSVARLSSGEQQTCFANMNAAGIKLSLGVAVLKEYATCYHASDCFQSQRGAIDQMIANGAQIGAFLLDEPLRSVRMNWIPGADFNYAVNETRTFISLLRQNYPGALVIEQEPYPFISNTELRSWIVAMGDPSSVVHPDYFEMDEDPTLPQDYNVPYAIRDLARSYGLGFSMLYAYTYGSGESAFYVGTDAECNIYGNIGADAYTVSAFYDSPQASTPETSTYTFMGTTRHLLDRGCVAGTPHQPPDVIFYEDITYGGASLSGTSDISFVGWDWNDRISSIRIPPGRTITIYEHADFGGASLTLTGDVVDLRNYVGPGPDGTWNDSVSSIRIQ